MLLEDCPPEAIVGRDQFEAFEALASEQEGRQVECVEGAKGSPGKDSLSELADRRGQLPEVAPCPESRHSAFSIGERGLRQAGLEAQAVEGSG